MQSVNDEIAGLYGSSWFYASFYLLMKSESREAEDGTRYFYMGGREAAYLYESIGWDFLAKDQALKEWYGREMARATSCGDRAAYDAVTKSLELYQTEKELLVRAARLGRFLGMDDYKEKIRAFVAAEEYTLWGKEHADALVERDAARKVLSQKMFVEEKDVLPLAVLDGKSTGKFMSVSFGEGFAAEPVRFLGKAGKNGEALFLLEHLREIGCGWRGNASFFRNVWDNASHDGCLEVIGVPEDQAENIYVGLNGKGSILLGRLEARCHLSDFGRKVKANVLGREHSLVSGKKVVPVATVLDRYKARNERLSHVLPETYQKQLAYARKSVLSAREKASDEVRTFGASGVERLDAMLSKEIMQRRQALADRFRSFSVRGYRVSGDPGRDTGKGRRPFMRAPERFAERKQQEL